MGKRRKRLIGLDSADVRLCLEKKRVEILKSATVLDVSALAAQLSPVGVPAFDPTHRGT